LTLRGLFAAYRNQGRANRSRHEEGPYATIYYGA
jgi:hypothetical protein